MKLIKYASILAMFVIINFFGATLVIVDAIPPMENDMISKYEDVLTDLESTMMSVRESALLSAEINPDVIGYIYMEGIVNEPVLSNNGKGVNYYERTNINHEYDVFGAVFLSDISQNDFSGNSLIYGHNSNIDRMFFRLQNLKKNSIDQEVPYLILYDVVNDEFKVSELYSVFSDNSKRFVIHQWTDSNKSDLDNSYNKEILYNKSQYNIINKEDVNFEADSIILETCTYYFDIKNPNRDWYAFFEREDLSIEAKEITNKLDLLNIEY